MEESIRIYLLDWQFNAGVVGLCNILELSGDEITVGDQFIEIDIKVFEGFSEKYFNYYIDKYSKNTPWYRIVSYEPIIKSYEDNNFENFNKKSLDSLNDYIRLLRDYLNRPNYKKVYPFIKDTRKILELVKKLTTIASRKQDKVEEKIEEVKEKFKVIKEIIDYCNSEDGKKYIVAKGVIYNFINNGWNGISFLHPQTKEHDVYKDYKEYFVNTTINYLKADKEKFQYNCFICDEKINDLNNHLSFLNNTGFDVEKKSSHVWGFTNDVATCDLCRLIYTCLPAGFVYAYDKGIFINSNITVSDLLRTNRTLRDDILKKDDSNNRSLTYRALINSINKEHTSKIQHQLQDIQIVRYEGEKYRFNILSNRSLRIIRDSEKELNRLMKTGYREGKVNFSIYDITIDRLLNNYNMFTLIHQLLIYKITNSESIAIYYHTEHVMDLIKININYLKGVEGLNESRDNKKLVEEIRNKGLRLRREYIKNNKDAEKGKLRGISYRLLNALKTKNSEMFMHNIITSYMYLGKTIPKNLIIALESEEDLGIVGYAFVTGLNGWNTQIEKEEGGENIEN